MTTIATNKIRCGHCEKQSDQRVIMSTNSFGSPDLDLRPPEMQRSTMPMWVQQCPHCGYVAAHISDQPADPGMIGSPGYRAALDRADLPQLARQFLAYAMRLDEPAEAGQAYLNVAWVCDDAQLRAQATEARRAAADYLQQAIAAIEEVVPRQNLSTIRVDVLRRSGDFEDAAIACAEMRGQTDLPPVLRDVIAFQQQLIDRKDDRCHTVAEAVQKP